MASSDTSEDENSELLREAVDTQFIHDDMFSCTHTAETKTSQHSSPNHDDRDLLLEIRNQPSLRPNTDKDDQFNLLGITPQFQQYVAKQLSIILDRKLNKQLTNGHTVNNFIRKRKKGGIKLFSDSSKYVKIPKAEALTNKVRRKCMETDSDNEAKCSEVSVNPDDILSKKDVKNWSSRSKAPVFRYKKSKSGTLTSVD